MTVVLTRTRQLLIMFFSGWLCLPSAVAHAEQVEASTFEYVIKKGDTCAKIALDHFGNRRRWDIIHKHNPNMGPPPHRLKPGDTLTLPTFTEAADAEVTQVLRDVRTREPAKSDWLRATGGEDLFRGWRVNTLDRSEAEVTFRDESKVHLRENTLVIIYGSTEKAARRRTADATLERGTLRGRLGELRMTVTTPNAEAVLQNGSSVISASDEGTSRLSHHEGQAVRFRAKANRQAVVVQPGYGSQLKKDETKPSKPRPLPPAPVWKSANGQFFTGFVGGGATIRGSWQGVKTAAYYRVEVTRVDEGDHQGQIIAALTVPASVTEFEVHRLPAGSYRASLATLDNDWFESKASAPLTVHTRLLALHVPGQPVPADVPTDSDTAPDSPVVLPGTRIDAPQGMQCTSTTQPEPSTVLVLTAPGEQAISCATGDKTTAPLLVRVVAPTLRLIDPPADGLLRGETYRLSLQVESTAALPPDARLRASEDVSVRDKGVEGDARIIEVTLAANAADEIELRLVGGTNANAPALATLTLPVHDPPLPPQAEPWHPTYAPNEALGLALLPTSFGLINDRRRGSGAWFSVAHHGDGPAGDGHWRSTVGLEVEPFRNVRLGMAHALDLAVRGPIPVQRGDRDFIAWLSYRFVDDEELSVDAQLGAWFPLGDQAGSLQQVRLTPSVSISFEAQDGILLRTRQGAMVDLVENGYYVWASAYGVDVRVAKGFAIASEIDLLVGGTRGTGIGGGAAGVGASAMVGPVSLYLMARYGFTEDYRRLVGRLSLTSAVRFAF